MSSTNLMKTLAVAAILAVPSAGHAVGGDDDYENTRPPAATETTKNCFGERQWDPETKRYVRFTEPVNGVWDPDTRRCVRPDKAGYLNTELLKDAVREMAYAGRYTATQAVLAQMDQADDLVLTYWGFTHRRMGDLTAAKVSYEAALSANPDNLLARSYMGQGFVAEGDLSGAWSELREIRARGGSGTWAEAALRRAIDSGTTSNY